MSGGYQNPVGMQGRPIKAEELSLEFLHRNPEKLRSKQRMMEEQCGELSLSQM